MRGGKREDPDTARRRLLLGALESDLQGREFEQYAGMSRSEARAEAAGEYQVEKKPMRGGTKIDDQDYGKRRMAIGALEDDMGDAEFVSYLGITRKEARDLAVGELDY